jgi:hypothetical protein
MTNQEYTRLCCLLVVLLIILTPSVTAVTGQISLSGDTIRIASGTDRLELRRNIGDVVDTMTGKDLAGLRSGHLTTSQGDTDYNQYIRFKDIVGGVNQLQRMGVNYVTNDTGIMADYLVVNRSTPFMEWEVQFPSDFVSQTYNDTDSPGWVSGTTSELRDFEDQTLNIMGEDYTIVYAQLGGTGPGLHLLLMSGSAPVTLKEGETKTVTLGGVAHEVTLLVVTNPPVGGVAQAKFLVDYDQTLLLAAGDTQTLPTGLQIGVRDILVNNQGGVASFFLGAHKILIDAPDITGYTHGGTIKIDQDASSDGTVAAQGRFTDNSNTTFRLNDLNYQLTMDANDPTTAYIPAGHGIRELMRRPAEFINPIFDITYEGLERAQTQPFTIKPQNNTYEVTFTNVENQTYTFPFVSNQNNVLRFGDQNDALVFVTTNGNYYNIGRHDYFIVSNANVSPDESVTNVLRYQSYDTTNQTLSFEDLSTGAATTVTLTGNTTGTGNLTLGDDTYQVNADNVSSTQPLLAIDLQGQSFADDFTWNTNLTLWGGVVIDLATSIFNGTDLVPLTPAIDGHGVNISTGTTTAYVTMSEHVLSKNFANQGLWLGETFPWQVLQAGNASNPWVDLVITPNQYSGPHADNTDRYTAFTLNQQNPGATNDTVGMTDWGIAIDHYKPSNATPGELTMQIPQSDEFAQVFITMGATTACSGTGCSTPTNTCGNGIVETGEACDAGARNGPCPAACSATCRINNCAVLLGGGGGGGGGGGSPITSVLTRTAAQHTLSTYGFFDFVLAANDTTTHTLKIKSVNGNTSVTLTFYSVPVDVTLTTGQETSVDVTGDGKPDVTVQLLNFTPTTATITLSTPTPATPPAAPPVITPKPTTTNGTLAAPSANETQAVNATSTLPPTNVTNLITGASTVAIESGGGSPWWILILAVIGVIGFTIWTVRTKRTPVKKKRPR